MQMIGANALLTIFAVITLVLAVAFNKTDTQNFRAREVNAPEQSAQKVLSEATIIPSPTPTSSPSTTPIAIAQATATPVKNQNTIELNYFWYPGANEVLREPNTFTLSSFADVDTIIDWYQNKLKEIKMPAKSIAKTNTNGNILAVLSGARENTKVNIEIKQSSTDKTVSIRVDISSN